MLQHTASWGPAAVCLSTSPTSLDIRFEADADTEAQLSGILRKSGIYIMFGPRVLVCESTPCLTRRAKRGIVGGRRLRCDSSLVSSV